MHAPLFDRLGGAPAIRHVIDAFYQRVVADVSLAGFFADLDMRAQRDHLAAFVGGVLGGPTSYRGRPMRAAHAGLGITDRDFDAVASHLDAALAGAGVGAEERTVILGAVEALRGEVVTAANGAGTASQ